MKIKLTLRGRGPSDINLLVTADNTATVGDIAAALASAGPAQAGALVDPATVTLRLLDPQSNRATAVLAPSAFITESELRSGNLVDITSADQAVGLGGDKAAEMRVLDGPDRGMVAPLPFGSSTLGRSRQCDVALTDPLVSKQHMRITIGAGGVEVHDLNSANGVVVGDMRVQRLRVGPADDITLGASVVRVVQLRQAEEGAADSTDIAFIRSPRVLPRVEVQQISIPGAPEPARPHRFPYLMMLAPMIMGAVIFAMTRNAMSMVFIGLSPLMMIGTWLDNRIQARKMREESIENYSATLALIRQDLEEFRRADFEARHAQFPPIETVAASAMRREGLMWSRRPEHPEFLSVRLGIGTDDSAIAFQMGEMSKGIPDCIRLARTLCDEFKTVEKVPMVVNLRAVGGLGLCGPRPWLQEIQAAVTVQMAALYSPAEVVIACLTSGARLENWEWLEWLPHTSSPHTPLAANHLASDSATGNELLSALEGVLDQRQQSATGADSKAERGPILESSKSEIHGGAVPAIVVIVDDVVVDRARLNRLAELGPDAGIHVVWSAETLGEIPAACRTFVAIDRHDGAFGEVRRGRVVHPVALDRLNPADARRFAKVLAPVVDAGVPVDDDSDLPRSISYVQLTGHDIADNPEAALERWRIAGSIHDRSPGAEPKPGPPVSLAAIVGQGTTSPVVLDLRTHGPHALVGGTTGAGKSEFLQAWVLGMAQSLSPDRVTFLFVDYKGGSAFARCSDLPHFVGMVTDLSPFLVRRALTSLRAELHHREELLNVKGAKDLATLEKRGDPECPPTLVIVVDEFAALVGEVPEFVDGIVDVAQRGRSLGLHLILATQRPAGVIKDNLRANTNLRVALRMADESDSQDVLGDKMAAHFPQESPGRGAAKTGPGRITVFQSAYPGAQTSQEVQAVSVGVEEMDFGTPHAWHVAEPPRPGKDVPQDLDRVVDTLREAARMAGIPSPRRPWLPELAQTYDIQGLNQRRDDELVLGVVDDPEKQAHSREFFFPDREGNIAFYGASGSGKTTALRTLAIAAGITPKSGPVDVYGLDYAGGGLDMLKTMPHVGDVVPGDNEERVYRVINMIGDIVDERAARFSRVSAQDLTAYRKSSGNVQVPRILLLIDNIGALVEELQSATRHQKLWNRFQQILLDGRSLGVHVAAGADRFQAIPTSLASNFQRKIVLRQADADAYLNFGVPRDVLSPTSFPGRALQVGDSRVLQIAIMGDNINTLAQSRLIEQLGSFMKKTPRQWPKPIGAMPEVLRAAQIPAGAVGRPVIGMGAAEPAPRACRGVGTLSVGGGPQTGRSNAVAWLAHTLMKAYPGATFLHASSGRSALSTRFDWAEHVVGVDATQEMIARHKVLFEEPAPESGPGVVLVVENLAGYVYSAADSTLTECIALARSNGHLVIAEADISGWSRAGGLGTAVKGGRAGLVLCPALSDSDYVIGVSAPALASRENVPGRGYFAQNGKIWKVQVPLL